MATIGDTSEETPPISPIRRGKSGHHSGTMDDSSDSEGEVEPSKSFHRRVSTSKQIKHKVCQIS